MQVGRSPLACRTYGQANGQVDRLYMFLGCTIRLMMPMKLLAAASLKPCVHKFIAAASDALNCCKDNGRTGREVFAGIRQDCLRDWSAVLMPPMCMGDVHADINAMCTAAFRCMWLGLLRMCKYNHDSHRCYLSFTSSRFICWWRSLYCQ